MELGKVMILRWAQMGRNEIDTPPIELSLCTLQYLQLR